MRKLERLLVVVAAAGVAAGCQDRSSTAPLSSTPVTQFQNGTWSVVTTWTLEGESSECQGVDPVVRQEQRVLCFESLADFQGMDSFETEGLSCDVVDSGGNTFNVSCSGTLDQGDCGIDFTVSGEGSATETSFSVAMDFTVTVTGPEAECGSFAEPCATRIEMTGAWISPDGDCPTEHAPPTGPLGDLMLGAMRSALDPN